MLNPSCSTIIQFILTTIQKVRPIELLELLFTDQGFYFFKKKFSYSLTLKKNFFFLNSRNYQLNNEKVPSCPAPVGNYLVLEHGKETEVAYTYDVTWKVAFFSL